MSEAAQAQSKIGGLTIFYRQIVERSVTIWFAVKPIVTLAPLAKRKRTISCFASKNIVIFKYRIFTIETSFDCHGGHFMAMIPKGFYLRISLKDNGGNTTIKTYKLRSADFTIATTDSATIRAALIAITDSVVSAYNIAQRFYEGTFVFPAAGVENENKASITAINNLAEAVNLQVPAPKIGIFTGPTGGAANIVDVENADLITYTDVFKSGAEAYVSGTDDLVALSSGKRISAKSNFG